MLRIISERTKLCACFIDWQKAFDRINWTKLMHILQETGIDGRERRFVRKLYLEQSVKVRLEKGKTRSVKTGREVRRGCCLLPVLFDYSANVLPRKLLKVLETSK
jgi:hypothetical protein